MLQRSTKHNQLKGKKTSISENGAKLRSKFCMSLFMTIGELLQELGK